MKNIREREIAINATAKPINAGESMPALGSVSAVAIGVAVNLGVEVVVAIAIVLGVGVLVGLSAIVEVGVGVDVASGELVGVGVGDEDVSALVPVPERLKDRFWQESPVSINSSAEGILSGAFGATDVFLKL